MFEGTGTTAEGLTMFVAGWGKGRTLLGGTPPMKCDNCKNTKPWLVWLIEKHADVYFVKFARWDKHVVCMCYVCEHGFELEEHKLKTFFFDTWKYVEMIFNDLDRSDQKRMIAGFERIGLRDEAKRLSEKRKKLF